MTPFSFAQLFEHPGDDDNLARIKLGLGFAALIALLYEAHRESEGTPIPLRWKKAVAGALAVLGVLSYFQFLDIGYPGFYHRHELFHYYLGSKYFRELGFEGIYTCTAVAESELPDGSAGPNDRPRTTARLRKLRDLRQNVIVDTTEWIEHPERCKEADPSAGRSGFSSARWEAFKKDVAFFRRVSLGSYWIGMQKDHGYNPPPVWGITGRFFAELFPADDASMKVLSAIDPLLLSAMFGFVAWAFGWRVMCLAVVFWGVQDASPFYWTGGAFLRQDWLFYAVVSACLVRKQRYFWGGAFLAYATLLRVFPIFFFLGWIVLAVAHAVRTWRREEDVLRGGLQDALRRLTHPDHRKLAAGALAAVLVLVPISVLNHGVRAWPDFVHHIAVHNGTPLTNHMGWKTLVAHSAAGRAQVAQDPRLSDPFGRWKDMRRARVKALAPVYWGGIALMMALFVHACARLRTPWIVQALGCLPAIVLVELTDYYLSFFLLGAMLSRGRRPIELALVVAAIGSELCHLKYGWFDDRFVAMSVVFLALALFFVVMYARRPWAARDVAEPAS